MKLALDTKVLAYAEGVNGEAKQAQALALVRALPSSATVLPVQVLGELFNVLVRKAGRSRSMAREAVLTWSDTFALVETSHPAFVAALDLARDHELGIWDALIVSVAARSNCRLLLSEDMQDGFTWSGVTVTNPFAAQPHPLLRGVLGR